MRTPPFRVALALTLSLFVARNAAAQGGDIHTVFGTRQANTPADLQQQIVQNSYTWEVDGGKATVSFKADGTGKQSFFNFTWRSKSAQQIEVTQAGTAKTMTLDFNENYSSFTGTDFDERPVRGAVVVPQTASLATPAVAKPSATPSNTNPFLSETLPGDGNGPDGKTALEKALANATFTWDPEGDSSKTVTFKADGTGQNTFFPIAWHARNAHEIEVTIPTHKDHAKIVLRFNNDYTKFTAIDFDGNNLSGHKTDK